MELLLEPTRVSTTILQQACKSIDFGKLGQTVTTSSRRQLPTSLEPFSLMRIPCVSAELQKEPTLTAGYNVSHQASKKQTPDRTYCDIPSRGQGSV